MLVRRTSLRMVSSGVKVFRFTPANQVLFCQSFWSTSLPIGESFDAFAQGLTTLQHFRFQLLSALSLVHSQDSCL